MKIIIRPETIRDYVGIKKVNDLAFGQPNEGLLIDKLRLNHEFIDKLSIIAEFENNIVGHILFFPIKIKADTNSYFSLVLAPMSVLPEFQYKGIGGKLINEGFKIAKLLGYESVVVLGHRDYYPRFGFKPAARWGIKLPFEVPEDVFMALELTHGALKEVSGVVQYPKEFDEIV